MTNLRDALSSLVKAHPKVEPKDTKRAPQMHQAHGKKKVPPCTAQEIKDTFAKGKPEQRAAPSPATPTKLSRPEKRSQATQPAKQPDRRDDGNATSPLEVQRTLDLSGYGALTPKWKEPESWVADGVAEQPAQGGKGRTLSVRLGVDFGTAYTKVAVRAADAIHVIDWRGLQATGADWMMPSLLSTLRDGSCWLGARPGAPTVVGELKQSLIERGGERRAAEQVAYLACVLRYARAWFFRRFSGVLSNRRVAWSLNLGIPAETWSDSRIVERYMRLGRAAWVASTTPGPITLTGSRAVLNRSELDGEVLVSAVPEFLAEIASYVRSAQRRDGLHMLVDVGGGTVDVATFNVFHYEHEERDRFPIFDCRVRPLGTHYLMRSRMEQANVTGASWDDSWPVPKCVDFAPRLSPPIDVPSDLDKQTTDQVAKHVAEVLRKTRMIRYRAASAWRDGIRVFLTGGGAYVDAYRHAVEQGCEALPVKPVFVDLPFLLEDKPEGAAINSEYRGRLAVACGLTFDAESTGLVLSPAEVEDDTRVATPVRDRPDRDELYAK